MVALGIRHVGERVAKVLAEDFADMDELIHVDEAQLTSINEIGAIIATSVVEWFTDEQNRNLIERLRAAGVNMQGVKKEKAANNGMLNGKTVVISGTLPNIKRSDVKALLEAAGAKVSGSVSKKTDYLLLGDNPGSKLDQAIALQVPQISWEEMQQMLTPEGQ